MADAENDDAHEDRAPPLGEKDPDAPKADQATETGVGAAKKRADQRLDEGLEETFPASDPVSAKHIT